MNVEKETGNHFKHEQELKTFDDAAVLWMKSKKNRVKESTFAVYYLAVQSHLLPKLGHLKLDEITEEGMNEYLDDLMNRDRLRGEGGLSWKTVSDIRSILRMILETASRNGYPHLGAIQLALPPTKPSSMQVLTREEQSQLVSYLMEHLTPMNLGILLSLFSGLRIGEVCGLRWGDIDFHYGTLRVSRTVIRYTDVSGDGAKKTKLMVTDPKTVNSLRTIPIPSDILALLEPFRQEPECYLISGTKQLIEPRRLRGRFKTVLQEAGIPDFRFHALRHSFATRCVEEEFDIKSLSEILGHSSVKITMDRYVHPSMDFKKQQMNRLKLS